MDSIENSMGRSPIEIALLDFEACAVSRRREGCLRLERLIAAFETHRERVVSRHEARFNVFGVLNVVSDEVRHSRFLSWLLKADGGHGQGPAFMESLLRVLQIDLGAKSLGGYRVRNEFVQMESIIDVMAYKPGDFTLWLENKIFAAEGDDQVNREYRDMCRFGEMMRIPAERRFAVFLSPDGRLPTSGEASHWIPLSYGALASAVTWVAAGVKDLKLRAFLEDWAETVSTWSIPNETV